MSKINSVLFKDIYKFLSLTACLLMYFIIKIKWKHMLKYHVPILLEPPGIFHAALPYAVVFVSILSSICQSS